MPSKPLSYEQLVALAEQPSDQFDVTSLQPDERRTVDQLRELLALMKDRESSAPPEHVRNRALRLMRPAFTAPAAGAGLLTRLAAVLSFDSQVATPALGVRGDTAQLRQLLFRAGSFSIDLQVFPQEGRLRLLGQVLTPTAELPSGQAVLSQGPRELAAASIDELGEFSFDALVPGAYALRIRLQAAEIDLPEIALSPLS